MDKKTPRTVIQRLAVVDLLDRASSGRPGPHAEGILRSLGTVGSGSHSGG